MAKIKNNFIGRVSGSVGDIVFKSRKGIPYISSKPEKIKILTDEKSVEIKSKFGFSLSLFSAMGKIKLFKDIWNTSNLKGETFIHKMFINYDRITIDRDISQVKLLPVEDGFDVTVMSTELNDKRIDIEISHPGVESGISIHKKISAQGILYLSEPIYPYDKQFLFIPYFSDDILAPDSGNLNFRLTREKNNIDLQTYNSKRFLFNLITKDKQNNPKNVSINIYQFF